MLSARHLASPAPPALAEDPPPPEGIRVPLLARASATHLTPPGGLRGPAQERGVPGVAGGGGAARVLERAVPLGPRVNHVPEIRPDFQPEVRRTWEQKLLPSMDGSIYSCVGWMIYRTVLSGGNKGPRACRDQKTACGERAFTRSRAGRAC